MTEQVRQYVAEFIKDKKFDKILEVGSREVNGKIRDLFEGADYTGVDMIAGDGVDVVLNGHDLTTKFKREFDLVMCLETLEHDDKFWVTIEQMKKVLKKGGWMVITVPGPRHPEHGWPSDYWRFMRGGVASMYEGFINVDVKEWYASETDRVHIDGWVSSGQK